MTWKKPVNYGEAWSLVAAKWFNDLKLQFVLELVLQMWHSCAWTTRTEHGWLLPTQHATHVCLRSLLTPSTRCKSVVSFTPWPLHPQENKPRTTEYEAGWTPEPVWKLARKTGLPPVPGVETRFPGCATCTSVTGSLGVQSLLKSTFLRLWNMSWHLFCPTSDSCNKMLRSHIAESNSYLLNYALV